MPTRRPHTKTRGGCATCKARKVRCDEGKPICRNCTRGSRTCRYPDQVLALPNALQAHNTDVQDQIFPIRDMELLHCFTASSYKALTDTTENYYIWQIVVPQMAFSYPFLLHGILTVAALHRRHQADEAQKEDLLNLARYHQQHALSLYIPLLQAINQENCHALFAFSIVVTAICFGMLQADNPNASQSLVGRIVEVFDAFTGAAVVAIEALDWLHAGPLQPIMDPLEPTNRDFGILEPGMRDSLESLLKLAEHICDEEDDVESKLSIDAELRRQAYTNAIFGISTISASAINKYRPIRVAVSWPLMAGNAYISLLRQRDPLAVVILAHYGVVLHRLSHPDQAADMWTWTGLGQRITEAAASELDTTWSPHISWAKLRVTGADTPQQSAPT